MLSQSLAVAADGVHVLFDSLAFGTALLIAWRAMPGTLNLHDLERRAKGKVFIAFLMALSGSVVLWGSIDRLVSDVPAAINFLPMLFAGAFGSAINCVQLLILRRCPCDLHLALTWHVRSDLALSIAALVSALLVYVTSLTRIDAVMGCVVGGWVIYSASRLAGGGHHKSHHPGHKH
jgi:Co/Zn/Cd efflux system component